MIPVCLPHQGLQLPIIPHTHVDVVSGAAAVASFVGELFMLKALLVYDPCGRRLGWGAPQNGARFVARAKKPGQVWRIQHMLSSKLGWASWVPARLGTFA